MHASQERLISAPVAIQTAGEFLPNRSMPKTALLIVQQERSDPGRVGALLGGRGYALDIRCPNLEQALPPTMEGHDAVVVFGGPMSANDGHDLPGIAAELDFIPMALESGKPFLGICLGAQLLARSLGSKVTPHPDGLAEIGYARITPTEAGKRYFDGPMMVYEWHREGFDLPPAATLLAAGEAFTNQAFRYGDAAYGIQFHPEVTRPMIERWTTKAAKRLKLPGAQPREAHFSGYEKYDAGVDAWIRRFIDHLFGAPATEMAPAAARR